MSIESLPFIYKSFLLTGKKLNRSLIMCTHGRDPGELNHHRNGQDPHLKHHLQLKTREDAGVGFHDLKGETDLEIEKQMFGKQMFTGPGRDTGGDAEPSSGEQGLRQL